MQTSRKVEETEKNLTRERQLEASSSSDRDSRTTKSKHNQDERNSLHPQRTTPMTFATTHFGASRSRNHDVYRMNSGQPGIGNRDCY
ncbi:hypothetical protein E6O75_ATG01713 [Venturia nashicola]|uniref:Uncharacterized protein n=1 Tax=Venturia nashicola TaxID=86259 RepID=A0A4Z1NSY6_9PEZI|nr:hypothetical protein E6O75_ATG01713 [Venturia nashicola]